MSAVTGDGVIDLTLYSVHCAGCGRLIGRSFTSRAKAVYCTDTVCPLLPRAHEYEFRNQVIRQLLAGGWTPGQIADEIGLSRQRVLQITEV